MPNTRSPAVRSAMCFFQFMVKIKDLGRALQKVLREIGIMVKCQKYFKYGPIVFKFQEKPTRLSGYYCHIESSSIAISVVT